MKSIKKMIIATMALIVVTGSIIMSNTQAAIAGAFWTDLIIGENTVRFDAETLDDVTATLSRARSNVTGDIIFPEKVKDLESEGYEEDHWYKLVKLRANIFQNQTGLTGVDFKNSVITTIGDNAFAGCIKLTSTGFENNSTIRTLGTGIFSGCIELEDTGLESNSTIESIPASTFSGCTKLKSTGLENNTSIKTIGADAFKGTGLTSVILPKQITNIETGAFANCSALTTFVFSGDIPTIAANAFSSGTHIYYPEGVNADNLIPGIGTSQISSYKSTISINDGYTDYHVGKTYSAEQVIGTNQYVADDKNIAETEISKEDLQNNLVLPKNQKLVAGPNTINGTYKGKPISFEVNASDHVLGEWEIESLPTITSTGSKIKKCTICLEEVERQVIDRLYSYEVLESEENYTKGTKKDITYKIDGDYDLFTGVKMNGKELSQEHYTASQGSTVITLKSAYLETLTEGNHEMTVVFDGNDVKISLAVKPDPNQTSNKPDDTTPNVPPIVEPDIPSDITPNVPPVITPEHSSETKPNIPSVIVPNTPILDNSELTTNQTNDSQTKDKNIVSTSDETFTLIYMGIFVLSGVIGSFVFKKRKEI